jgi:hypothetical protein
MVGINLYNNSALYIGHMIMIYKVFTVKIRKLIHENII